MTASGEMGERGYDGVRAIGAGGWEVERSPCCARAASAAPAA